jgi:hypothetical protein
MVLKTVYLRVLNFMKFQIVYSPLNFLTKEMKRRNAERAIEKIKTFNEVEIDQDNIKGNYFSLL